MPSQEDINNQLDLLSTYRRSLAHYLKQQAALGSAHTPPGVSQGIFETRQSIRHIKNVLRNWNIATDDLPDDDEESSKRKTVRFHDNFDSISNFWPIGRREIADGGFVERVIRDGRYIWNAETSSWHIFSSMVSPFLSDYEVEMKAQCTIMKGTIGYGLQFGRNDYAGRYMYYIRTDGMIDLDYYDQTTDKWSEIMSRTHRVDMSDIQILRVLVQNQRIKLWLNDELKGNFAAPYPVSGRIAPALVTIDAAMANITIRSFTLTYDE